MATLRRRVRHRARRLHGKRVDQLAEVVRKLRHNPYDRRMILSAWNPADLRQDGSPALSHVCAILRVIPASTETKGRPAHPPLPTLLRHGSRRPLQHRLLRPAHAHPLPHLRPRPGTLTHTMGDAHIYLDHSEALQTQITREPREFPTLEISERMVPGQCEVDSEWKVEDFEVRGYVPHKGIAMKMSV
ncbi:hypothetical protein BTJ68_14736 [Hortaea werneckii EXF-2000]|uniref:thymidylate synthase n=1 Tax=Hortaea werneckii EXF-2000 TaxID=1157616 RepID=A0A1Z5SN97_HORWE|nr:hypothetical protein BTJ68_14736 [Hortaea werneckii EXF-2000]